jgi:hypothetical protein
MSSGNPSIRSYVIKSSARTSGTRFSLMGHPIAEPLGELIHLFFAFFELCCDEVALLNESQSVETQRWECGDRDAGSTRTR